MSVASVHSVRSVVTHARPHLDELSAKWALDRFGKEKYPCVSDAPLVVFDPAIHLDGRSEENWLQEGVLFLGVRGGRFDDHPHEAFPDDCCFTLVLKDLGHADDPCLRDLVRYILHEDKHGAPHPLHLASVVKKMHRTHGVPDIYAAVVAALEGLYDEQVEFQEAVKVIKTMAEIQEIANRPSGAVLRLCIIDGSDLECIGKAARFKDGCDAALVVHRNTSGHVVIFGSKRHGTVDLSPLVETLRFLEQVRNQNATVMVSSFLRSDGTLPEIPQWCYQNDHQAILNGSLTAPHVPPTGLSLQRIVEACREYLQWTRFRPQDVRTMQ